ncbi:hypothetical protein KC853_00855 [Candidatus Saccharibacteria bacterium]|nr:hypothetical protein [Candidatus Saccharibacteria bacterium]
MKPRHNSNPIKSVGDFRAMRKAIANFGNPEYINATPEGRIGRFMGWILRQIGLGQK